MNNSLEYIRTMGKYTGMMLAGTILLAAMCIPSSNTLKPLAASSELAAEELATGEIHCLQDDIIAADAYTTHASKGRSDSGPSFGPILPAELNRMTNEFRRKSDTAISYKLNCPSEVCVTPVRVYHRSD